MPEYRHNLITNRWVIIASQRNSRPRNFSHSSQNKLTDFDPECPFCPGNEKMTPPETFAIRDAGSASDGTGWSIRVVPNKFPFLAPNGSTPLPGENLNHRKATGRHEVLIDSPHHSVHLANQSFEHTCSILQTLRNRYQALAADDYVNHISIFCNHGRSSGASLAHPHFQIAAGSLVPPQVAAQIEYCRRYYNTNNHSVFQDTIETELVAEELVIAENNHFLAFCPPASMCTYEVYILPRLLQPRFGLLSDEQIPDLTEVLQKILKRLDTGYGNPDYNLIFHTAPVSVNDSEQTFRWYIQLYPRLSLSGGFELATDIYINIISPKSAAAFYRNETD